MPPPVEVLVLGAGIAGCALAYHLAQRNVGPVVVVDPQTPAAGATGRAAGILTEQLWSRWDVEVTRESKSLYAELSARHDPEAYEVNGFVRWAATPGPIASLEAARDRWRAWGVPVEELPTPRLAELVPWGRFDDAPRSAYTRADSVVTPSAITNVLVDRARAAGVEFRFGARPDGFGPDPVGWKADLAGAPVRARQAVVAAGAWSPALFEAVGAPQPIVPYRTQAAVLRPAQAPATFVSVHDVETDVYARPESHGRILAGDGTDLTPADPDRYRTAADPSFVAGLAEVFGRRLPGWADAELVRAWAGLCTSTPDRRPLVGPVPDHARLFALVGFNGFGVMRAGGVARRLADLIASGGAGNRETERLAPALPERFRGVPPRFAPRPGFTLDDGADPRY
ncbi:MAG TPA: FAD-dependent oxidoreductase [Thermoplasmata archaeon]|nr:FAD-dependent oxidoreductase [Thermoplasmata archaeon]